MPRLRALLASLRIANAPSVVSNVWLGYMLGWFYWGISPDPFSDLARLSVIGLCLFFAGNLANDWFDRAWDRQHRPERALPSNLFSPFSYIVAAAFLALNGLLAAATISYPVLYSALAILALIALYTYLHKRTRWAVVPMGLCRAGLYFMGFLTLFPRDLWDHPDSHSYGFLGASETIAVDVSMGFIILLTHALGLLIYIAGLSLAARYESADHPPHGMVVLSRAMLFLPLAAMSAWWIPYYPLLSILGLVPFAIWLTLTLTRFRRPVPVLVSALLAGIPLIDFIAALPLACSSLLPDQLIHHQPLLLATVLVPLLAFALGRLLQRLAPAT